MVIPCPSSDAYVGRRPLRPRNAVAWLVGPDEGRPMTTREVEAAT